MSLLIRGGTVVNADTSFRADVLCVDGKIAAVGEDLEAPAGAQIIDAGGRLVMPGGIDPHTHMQLPFMGTVASRRLLHRHRGRRWPAAPPRIIDFVIPNPQQPLMEAYQQVARLGREGSGRLRLPRRRHLVGRVGAPRHGHAGAPSDGVNSFKHFMAYKNAIMCDDETLVNSFTRALRARRPAHRARRERRAGLPLAAARCLRMGITGPEGHPLSRPPMVEGEAANRAIAHRRGAGRADLRRARLVHRAPRGHRARPRTTASASLARCWPGTWWSTIGLPQPGLRRRRRAT